VVRLRLLFLADIVIFFYFIHIHIE
jgi:hypothetical protein